MNTNEKMVFFESYCPTCKYEEKEETEEPCKVCLCHPVNQDTHKPTKWEDKNE